MRILSTFLLLLISLAECLFAGGPSMFSYQGRLFDDNGDPIGSGSALIVLQVLDPAGNCLLFEESHSVLMTDTEGYFRVSVGLGAKNTNDAPNFTFKDVFSNASSFNDPKLQCASYTPGTNDHRLLRVHINGEKLVPDHTISAVPFSIESQNTATIEGKTYSDITDYIDKNFAGSTLPDLQASPLSNGDSFQWNGIKWVTKKFAPVDLPSNSVTLDDVNFASNNGISVPSLNAAPASPNAGQIYYNSVDNKIHFHNGTAWVDITATSGGDFKSDGSIAMGASLNLNGNYLSGDSDAEGIFVNTAGNVGIGTNTPAASLDVIGGVKVGTMNTACIAGIEGALRYNSSVKKMELCDGGAWREIASQVATSGGGATSFSEGTTFHEGGDTYFCKKTTVDSNGVNQGSQNINEGSLCDSTNNLTCETGECSTFSIFVSTGGAKKFHASLSQAYAKDCGEYKSWTGYSETTGGTGNYWIDPNNDGADPIIVACEGMTGVDTPVTGIITATSGISPLAYIETYNSNIDTATVLKLTGDGFSGAAVTKCAAGTNAVYSSLCNGSNANVSTTLAITLGDRSHLSAPSVTGRINLSLLLGAQPNYSSGVEYDEDELGTSNSKWYQWFFANGSSDSEVTNNMLDHSILGSGTTVNPFVFASGSHPTSCLAYLNSAFYNSHGDGIYTIDPDGAGAIATMNVYCDQTADGGGWTLLSSGGSSCGSFVSNTAVELTSSCGYMPEPNVRAIALGAATIRLRSGGSHASYSQVTSSGANALAALRTGGNWHNGAQGQFSGWTWAWSCGPSASQWPNMFHACNFVSGVHWLAATRQSHVSGAQGASSAWLK